MEKSVVYFLRTMKDGFDKKIISDETIFNVDETHLLVDERSGKVYGLAGAPMVRIS